MAPETRLVSPSASDRNVSADPAPDEVRRLQARVDELEQEPARLRTRRAVRTVLVASRHYGQTRELVQDVVARTRPRSVPDGHPLVLHIGLPKTATTWLQYRVFNRQREIAYLHDPRDRDPDGVERLLKRYQHAPSDDLPALGERLAAALPDHELLVSNENISMLTKDVWRGTGPTPERLARRLGRISRSQRPVRVILGIRRQDQWLGSMYAQSAPAYPQFGQQDFESRLRSLCEHPLAGAAGHLEYDRLVRALVRELGRDNVLVLPSELLGAAPEEGLAELDRFLGMDVFVRTFHDGTTDRDPVNVRSAGRNTWTLKNREEDVVLPDALADRVLGRFARSNARLARRLGADLGRFGYH